MKFRKAVSFLVAVVLICSAIILTGCGDDGTTGGTIEEPEISVEYLAGEYKDQLVRDGAEHMLGSIAIEEDQGGNPVIHIDSKSIVKNQDYEKGYYIADRNISKDVPLSPEARVTYLKKDSKTAEVYTVDQLIKAAKKDNTSDREVLYDVYIIGEQVELVLSKKIK